MPDALSLLRALIGQRVEDEPDAAEALAAQCGRLPLALRIAAEMAIARPGAALAELAIQLDDRERRLDLLDRAGDPRSAVRTIFSWSYRNLDAGTARAFRLASLHPGPDFDAYGVAALTGSGLAETRDRLHLLARSYLIQHTAPDRYGMHDLLRAYARTLAGAHDGELQTRAALTQSLDYYLATAGSAMDTLHPAQRHLRPRVSAPATPAPPLAAPDAAMAWLDAERPSLVAVAAHAADNGWADHATRLSGTLFRYLQDGSHIFDGFSIYAAARRASLETGDLTAEAGALTGLGLICSSQGSYAQAICHYRRALLLFRTTADRIGQARVLHNLANVNDDQGDYAEATRHYQQSLDLFRQVGEPVGQGLALNGLGNLVAKFGQDQQATSHFREALALLRTAGYETCEAGTLTNLGRIDQRLGRYQEAAESHRQARSLFRHAGNRSGEADALHNLGLVETQVGRHREAAECQRQALTILRGIGDLAGEAESRIYLGEALLADGHPREAEREHTIALRLARQVSHRRWQARSHDGLGSCYFAVSNASRAREHWLQALAGYTEIGLPEAAEVRERLAPSTRPAAPARTWPGSSPTPHSGDTSLPALSEQPPRSRLPGRQAGAASAGGAPRTPGGCRVSGGDFG
jgi:tetratricopeptide (TPR) repeat protein